MSAQSLPQTTSRRLPTTYHSVHPGFYARKQQILASLIDPTITRTDNNNNVNKYSSSKVSSPLIDEPIFPIIELINKHEDYTVTSSCSGKISIISTCSNNNKCKTSKKSISGKVESLTTSGNINYGEPETGVVYKHQNDLDDDDSSLKFGGGGGKLLFIAHSKINLPKEKDLINNFLLKLIFADDFENVITSNNESYDLSQNNNYNLIYFKFDPMILHAEARTLDAAKNLVNLAVEIGYRDSGLLTTSKRHMVAIRDSMKLETPIAYLNLSTQKIHLLVELSYLNLLINLSNQNFDEILRKINDLLSALDNNLFRGMGSGDDGVKKLSKDGGKTWDKEERRERKRRDVLSRQIGLRKSGTLSDGNDGDVSTVDDESQGLDNLDNV
ncbi:28570_t:CDS:2 [Dentiscutata erythropus]|uniref:tRNA(Phe) 7-[(3-amino-3-carboxypropyl)-4-demethylwyosine(37)-N(4)]-methyltransferase n=1 Tax=Dentiscutata erythropus TaxID=1348616 RepID=A0A9N9HDU9_9GLOM|nr:28570_t:CDS:2 [Dentiscutata erythropus]